MRMRSSYNDAFSMRVGDQKPGCNLEWPNVVDFAETSTFKIQKQEMSQTPSHGQTHVYIRLGTGCESHADPLYYAASVFQG